MAFEDTGRVTAILERAGLRDVRGTRHEVALLHPRGAAFIAEMSATIGPATRILADNNATPQDRQALSDEVTRRFAAYESGDGLAIPATVTLYSATA